MPGDSGLRPEKAAFLEAPRRLYQSAPDALITEAPDPQLRP